MKDDTISETRQKYRDFRKQLEPILDVDSELFFDELDYWYKIFKV